jgi:hypothetical protein
MTGGEAMSRAPHRRTYIEPARRWGWIAVAYEPVEDSKWFLPPKHEVWRPTKQMALNAVPKAVSRLLKDVERRERDVAKNAVREGKRVPVPEHEEAIRDLLDTDRPLGGRSHL